MYRFRNEISGCGVSGSEVSCDVEVEVGWQSESCGVMVWNQSRNAFSTRKAIWRRVDHLLHVSTLARSANDSSHCWSTVGREVIMRNSAPYMWSPNLSTVLRYHWDVEKQNGFRAPRASSMQMVSRKWKDNWWLKEHTSSSGNALK